MKKNAFKKRSAQAPRLRSGQAMLVAILMITAAALAIGLAVATVGSSEVIQCLAAKQSAQADTLAETCLEDTLMRFARADTSQPAPFTNSIGSCTIEISGGPPAAYQILSKASVARVHRNLRATVAVTWVGSEATDEILKIQAWEEIY